MPRHDQQCKTCPWTGFNLVLSAGEHPPCPMCGDETERLWTRAPEEAQIARDEIPGGVIVENYGPTPMRFDSHSERRAYMKRHGLQERETFAPMPGTDKDPQGIPNPKGYVDAYTLEAGKTLMLRQQGAPKEPEFDGSTVLTDLQTGDISERDVIAVTSGDARRQSRLHRRMTRG